MNQLSTTFAGAATQSANTFQGSMDKLSVASANVQEIIGKGIIDSLKILADDTTVDDLATGMEEFATAISESIQGLAILIDGIKSIPKIPGGGSGAIFDIDKLFKFTGISMLRKIFDAANKGMANDPAAGLAHLAELEASFTAATLKSSKKLTAEELKQLKAKQLKAAIDKANLALGKGSNVFDMEKIQLAAAEVNAAAQLGKVTSQAQLLQITNDLARLEVKQSILDLEDAIASKDVAAITNATNKLNADLKVLGALTGQKVKLTEIEDILKAMLPKDLINLKNLNDAIALLKIIGGGTATSTSAVASTTTGTSPKADAGIAAYKLGQGVALTADELAILGMSAQSPSSNGGGSYGGTPNFTYGNATGNTAPMGYGGVNITVNTGIGDPNAIAEAIDQVLRDASDRGTLRVA